MAASHDLRPEQVPNANYTAYTGLHQCPLLFPSNDRELEQEATTEKISDVITKKFSPTTNQPTNLIPHYKGVMCV